MSPNQFNLFMLMVFGLTVTATAIGFTYFMKWFRREQVKTVPREELERRAAAIDAKYRREHPEIDDEAQAK